MLYSRIFYTPSNLGVPLEITKYVSSWSITDTVGVKKSTFKITVKNPNWYWSLPGGDFVAFNARGLDIGTTFSFYVAENAAPSSLFFEGSLQSTSVNEDNKRNLIDLSGIDSNAITLSNLWSKSWSEMTASEIVIDAAKSALPRVDVSNVQPTTGDVQYTARYYPLWQILEELGATNYTGKNNQFITYSRYDPVTRTTYIYWKEPETTSSSVFDTVSYHVTSIINKRESEGAVNHVIYYCGLDKDGVGMTDHWFDPTIVGGKNKSVWMNYEYVSDEIKKRLGPTAYDAISNADFKKLCVGKDSNGVSSLGESLAKTLVVGLGNPRYDVVVIMKGTFDFKVGDLVKVSSLSSNLNNKLLRVNQITQSFDSNNGWVTTINFKEDAVAIVTSQS